MWPYIATKGKLRPKWLNYERVILIANRRHDHCVHEITHTDRTGSNYIELHWTASEQYRWTVSLCWTGSVRHVWALKIVWHAAIELSDWTAVRPRIIRVVCEHCEVNRMNRRGESWAIPDRKTMDSIANNAVRHHQLSRLVSGRGNCGEGAIFGPIETTEVLDTNRWIVSTGVLDRCLIALVAIIEWPRKPCSPTAFTRIPSNHFGGINYGPDGLTIFAARLLISGWPLSLVCLELIYRPKVGCCWKVE